MILNMIGGSGSTMNFEIVGGISAPSSPSENTIWINTDQEITDYVFSATAPLDPVDGFVWNIVGTSSSIAFSVTEENPIMVYPLAAKQFSEGSGWVNKTAKIWQNGWVDWTLYYFNYGDQAYQWQARKINFGYTAGEGTGTLAENTDGSVTYGVTADANGSTQKAGVYELVNDIDLTNVKALHIDLDVVKTSYPRYMGFCVYNRSVNDPYSSAVAKIDLYTADVTDEGLNLDVSSLTGQWCIGIGLSQPYGNKNITISITLKSIYAIF